MKMMRKFPRHDRKVKTCPPTEHVVHVLINIKESVDHDTLVQSEYSKQNKTKNERIKQAIKWGLQKNFCCRFGI